MKKAINNNILTNEAMRDSLLFSDYWFACYELAKALVKANYPKTEKARDLMSWDYEDLVSEFSIQLERKFETQVKAILNPRVDENGNITEHNFNGYNTAILKKFLIDKIDKYAIKTSKEYIDKNNKKHRITINLKKEDENGQQHNIYWEIDSMSRSISDDDSLTLGDTLESNTFYPEDSAIAMADKIESKAKSFEYLRKMCKMKAYLGCVYVYIEDKLIENYIPCSLESMLLIFKNIEKKSPAFQATAKKAFIRAYNNDLVSFVDFISENAISDDAENFIFTHYAKSFNDFGRVFNIDEDTIYHRRDEYKRALAKITGIEIPKKFKKKFSK